MQLSEYRPHSKLVTRSTSVTYPKFPVIDGHNHLAEPFGGGFDKKPLSDLLKILDQAGVEHYVDLDGGFGHDLFLDHLKKFKKTAPDRFTVFGGILWEDWSKHGDKFPEITVEHLKKQKELGAGGLKIWKGFGLRITDHHKQLVRVSDERLDPVFAAAGMLKLPILIHVADPVAFFDPIDETNERYEELILNPDWAFTSPPFPPFLKILEDLADLIRRHPDTVFIGAHVGCYAENLQWVGNLLSECPNFFVDISGRIGELGRQPYSAREFFLRYKNRIIFGTDVGPDLPTYHIHYRFLETSDEYFDYGPDDIPGQGRWKIHGLNLPDDVLKKVYSENARRIILDS